MEEDENSKSVSLKGRLKVVGEQKHGYDKLAETVKNNGTFYFIS
ncbi:hypothetical protein [Bulleidia sp. HCP3S3_F2]